MAAGGKRRHGGLGLAAFRRKSGVRAKGTARDAANGELPIGAHICPVCGLDCGDWSGCCLHLLEYRSPGFRVGDKVRCVADPRKRGRAAQIDSDHRLMTVRLEYDDGSSDERRVLIWLLDKSKDQAHYFWELDGVAVEAAAI